MLGRRGRPPQSFERWPRCWANPGHSAQPGAAFSQSWGTSRQSSWSPRCSSCCPSLWPSSSPCSGLLPRSFGTGISSCRNCGSCRKSEVSGCNICGRCRKSCPRPLQSWSWKLIFFFVHHQHWNWLFFFLPVWARVRIFLVTLGRRGRGGGRVWVLTTLAIRGLVVVSDSPEGIGGLATPVSICPHQRLGHGTLLFLGT